MTTTFHHEHGIPILAVLLDFLCYSLTTLMPGSKRAFSLSSPFLHRVSVREVAVIIIAEIKNCPRLRLTVLLLFFQDRSVNLLLSCKGKSLFL